MGSKNKMKTLIIMIFLNTMMTGAFAGIPVKHASCNSNINLVHPANSSGVYFDADCKTVYVLPPTVSDVAVTGISATSNIRKCEILNSMLNIDEIQAKKLEIIMSGGQSQDGSGGFGPGIGGDIDRSIGENDDPETASDFKRREEAMTQYLELSARIEKRMESFKDVQAASATISFSLPWDKLVNQYAQFNASKGLKFVRMPIDAAYLSFNRTISKVGTLPAVLDYDIPGLGAANSGIGDAASAHGSTTSLLVGDSYSGQIILSLAGACPFYMKATRTVRPSINGQPLTALLNANLNYSYGLQVYRKYFVKYNFSLLAKHIKESSTNGGFFSTSTSTKVINSTEGTDWFEFKNESNDARFNPEALVSELKADAINRVIRDIGMANGYSAPNMPQVQARTQNGAQVASDELQKCPHVYCQGAAVTLKVLDSIFGSSDAVNTYINEKHLTAGDSVEENKVIRFYGSSIFKN
jgi:hypothetical protein